MSNANPTEILLKTISRIDGAYAPATIRAYKENFLKFISYCDGIRASSIPADPATVTGFISSLSDGHLKSASIRLAISAVSAVHRLNRHPDPTKDPDVKIEVRRMHRKLGRSAKQAIGITADILEIMLASTDGSIRGIRDKALLLLAYDSLCRRSELVSLQYDDVTHPEDPGLLKIVLRKSKTDPEGAGRCLFMSEKSRLAVYEWIKASGVNRGPLFRKLNNHKSERSGLSCGHINKIYKQLAEKANLDIAYQESISGHSPRVGCAQDLMKNGASMPMIMSRGRWTKVDTVMRYIENAL